MDQKKLQIELYESKTMAHTSRNPRVRKMYICVSDKREIYEHVDCVEQQAHRGVGEIIIKRANNRVDGKVRIE